MEIVWTYYGVTHIKTMSRPSIAVQSRLHKLARRVG